MVWIRFVFTRAIALMAPLSMCADVAPSTPPPSTPLNLPAIFAPDLTKPPIEVVPVGTADPTRFTQVFTPFRTTSAALSPDGKYLAYSIRENEKVSVVIVEIDHPEKAKSRVTVATDETSTPIMAANAKEKTPAQIRWMGWATPTRLIVETNTIVHSLVGEKWEKEVPSLVGKNWENVSGVISAIDANGGKTVTLVTPMDIGEFGRSTLMITPSPNPSIVPVVFRPDQDTPPEETGGLKSDVIEVNLPPDPPTPRSPRFFDYCKDDPDYILVRGADLRKYGIFKVNIYDGRIGRLSKEEVGDSLVPLVDRQGKPRLAIAASTLTSFPHRYLVEKPSRFSFRRWNDLNKIKGISGSFGFMVTPENYLGQRSFPVGFDEDPNVLYYASNIGRDTYGIYGLNLKTGERTGEPIESAINDMVDPAPEGFLESNPLVFDRFQRKLVGLRYQARLRSTVWLRPEWQEVQAQLEAQLAAVYPGSNVEIQEWDQTGRRFLALVRSPADSGGYFILDREKKQLSEFVRRAPWQTKGDTPIAINFSFENPAGGNLTGIVVIPRAVRQKPIPLVVYCQPEPWQRTRPEFQTEVHAFAQMGFAILQLNPRGAWGFGIKHREAAMTGFDRVQVDDVISAIDMLSKVMPIHTKNVAVVGERRGGYLALRAAQLRPDRFRCAVAIDGTLDLNAWLAEARWTSGAVAPALMRPYFGDAKKIGSPLLNKPDAVTTPVFLMAHRGPDGEPVNQSYLDAKRFASAVARKDVPAEVFDLSLDYMRGLPNARADALRHMEDFLNVHIYGYRVNLGKEHEVK